MTATTTPTTCTQAITDFRRRRDISDAIVQVDWTGVHRRKTG